MEGRGDAADSVERRMAGVKTELASFQANRALYQEVIDVHGNTATEEALARIAARYSLSNLLKA